MASAPSSIPTESTTSTQATAPIQSTAPTEFTNPTQPNPASESTTATATPAPTPTAPVSLPRVAIKFCTQCRWMLRAAYFAQELLSTFGTQIGEIALIPATGGLFTVELTYAPPSQNQTDDGGVVGTKTVLLWDRKAKGGFPETKVLKQLVRDHIDPAKDLGHSDRGGKKKEGEAKEVRSAVGVEKEKEDASGDAKEVKKTNPDGTICEDCR